MTLTTEQKLAAIHNRHTRYEVAAINGDRQILIAYTARHSRSGLLGACRTHGAALVALTGADSVTFGKRASDGATLGTWQIRFTGRTQREAIIMGELPWIKELGQPVAA